MNYESIIDSVYASLAEITLISLICTLLLLDLVLKGKKESLMASLAFATVFATAMVSLILGISDNSSYNGMFVLDSFSLYFKLLLYLATGLVLLLSFHFLRVERLNHTEYYLFILFALCGMMLMVSAADLISLYVGLELMSLSVYLLTGYLRTTLSANEAALKYLVLGALSSATLLYGISFIYGLTGTTVLSDISQTLTADEQDKPAVLLATALLLAGFAFKLAAVPFHMWAPDVYQGAPTSITAFMSVGPKLAGFAVLLRVFISGLGELSDIWLDLVMVIALASLILGSVMALVQSNIKRLLAYSSISHGGFILLGLVTGHLSGLLYYLQAYLFMSLGAFAVIIALHHQEHKMDRLVDLTGLAKQHPGLALLMLLFLFSLAGIPPTAGFFAKFYIILALIEQQYIGLALTAVLMSVVSAVYYLRIIMLMFMTEPEQNIPYLPDLATSSVLLITTTGTLALGLFPGWTLSLIERVLL